MKKNLVMLKMWLSANAASPIAGQHNLDRRDAVEHWSPPTLFFSLPIGGLRLTTEKVN